jgi:hypothetical protein
MSATMANSVSILLLGIATLMGSHDKREIQRSVEKLEARVASIELSQEARRWQHEQENK